VYLLAVAFRIDGCYAPDGRPRDEVPDRGPRLGEEFPPFLLHDLTGAAVGRNPMEGKPAVLVFVPSLDWSPPTKARLIDLTQAVAGRPDVAITVVLTDAQATARSLAFVRDRRTSFRLVIDTGGVTERLGLTTADLEGKPAALPATFVLDPSGVVRLRDVRQRPRTWLAPEVILELVTRLAAELTA
jgi:peroxiredoxin